MEAPLAEQLKRITTQRKTVREEAGIELETVATETFIPLRLLRAMDEGKFERLPEPVFIQGFIRRYGDVVGLDGRQLSQEFAVQPPVLRKPPEEYLSQSPEEEAPAAAPRNARKSKLKVPAPLPPEPQPASISESPVTPATDAEVTPPVTPEVSPVVEPSTVPDSPSDDKLDGAGTVEPAVPPSGDMSSEPERPAVDEQPNAAPVIETSDPQVTPEPVADMPNAESMTSDAVTSEAPSQSPRQEWSPSTMGSMNAASQSEEGNKKLIIGIVIAGALLLLGGLFLAQPQGGNDQKSSETETSVTQSKQPEAKPSPSPSPVLDAPIVLAIKVTDASWTEVIVDGQVVLSETLTPGTTKTFKGQERISITSGNAQGVTYSLNQSPEQPMDSAANPKTLVFTPEGLN